MSRVSRRLSHVAACAAFAALGCDAPDLVVGAPVRPVPVTRLRAEPYSFSYHSGFDQPARLVVRDDATWRAAWRTAGGSVSPQPPLPAVDFSRETVVVVSSGMQPSGGHSIYVDSAATDGAATVVWVRTVSPGAGCGAFAVITQPADVARLARVPGPVVFREQAIAPSCG